MIQLQHLLKQHHDAICYAETHPTVDNIHKLIDNYILPHIPLNYQSALLDWQIKERVAEDYKTILETHHKQTANSGVNTFWRERT